MVWVFSGFGLVTLFGVTCVGVVVTYFVDYCLIWVVLGFIRLVWLFACFGLRWVFAYVALLGLVCSRYWIGGVLVLGWFVLCVIVLDELCNSVAGF